LAGQVWAPRNAVELALTAMHHYPTYCDISAEESTESRCISLVMRCAGKFMRIGGGSLIQPRDGNSNAGRPLTAATKRRIEAALLETGGTKQAVIGRRIGVAQASVNRVWQRMRG